MRHMKIWKKKEAAIFVHEGSWGELVQIGKEELENAGYKTRIVGIFGNEEVHCIGGTKIQPDMSLEEALLRMKRILIMMFPSHQFVPEVKPIIDANPKASCFVFPQFQRNPNFHKPRLMPTIPEHWANWFRKQWG